MRRISDTIGRLAAMRANLAGMPRPVAEDRLTDLSGFGSNPGALRARTYIPADLPPGAPLVVVLHGCTQTAAGYDHGSGWSRLAERCGFALLYPEQQRANNANLCFNWFVPEDTRRDSGEALSIRQMIEAVCLKHGSDRKRIFVTGLSAGGAMTATMLATYPELFAGGAIIAGLPHGVATSVPEAFDRMRGHGMPDDQRMQALLRGASTHRGPWPSVSVWHGDADRTVDIANAGAVVAQWRGVHGLQGAAAQVDLVDGCRRLVWRDASGRVVLESITVPGLGHGTPLHTLGEHGLGTAMPFMLEAGISSTLHIARSWGLLGSGQGVKPDAGVARPGPSAATALTPPDRRRPAASGTAPLRPGVRGAERPTGAEKSSIATVIEDALRKAGLM